MIRLLIRIVKGIGSAIGIGARAFVVLVGIAGITAAVANYTMTQGVGLTFGSIVVGGVHYAQQLICDVTTPSQCAAVNASGNQLIDWTVGSQAHADAIAPVASQSPAVPIGGVSICDGANGTTNPCTTPATVKAASTLAAFTDKALVVDQRPADLRPGSGTITIADTGSSSTTGQNGIAIITGTPTAGSFYTQAINSESAVRVQVSGTWTGTLQFEGSVDGGTTWTPTVTTMVGTSYGQTTITGNGNFTAAVAGLTNYRVRATAAVTGTATVQAAFSPATGPVQHSIRVPMTLASGAPLVKGTISSAMTGTASVQLIAAVTGQRIYVTRIKCNNTHASVSTAVLIQDGSAGTTLDTLAAGANYSGEQGTGQTPLFWTTSGNGLFAQNVTTGANVFCTASGYSGN